MTTDGKNLLGMIQKKLKEKEELIQKLEARIKEVEDAAPDPAQAEEKEAIIKEQMAQIHELTDRADAAEKRLKEAEENLREFDSLQNQLKELLGEA